MGCSGWVHKQCSFVCKMCERGDKEDRSVEESLDLGNGVHLENFGKFCYLCGGSLRSYQGC